MPTKHRRIAITETPQVQQAIEELRKELGTDQIPLAELVVLGAEEKLRRLSQDSERTTRARKQLADWIRTGTMPVDPAAAEEVRRTGWARLL